MNFELVKPDTWMSIDNATVVGMTFAGLPSNIYIAQWRGDRGEVEYSDQPPGLRTVFVDIMPYVPAINEFMTLMPDMTLAQAKKIKTDLLQTIYDSLRQLPYVYPIGGTSYTWAATDSVIAMMSLQVVPIFLGSGGTVNNLVDQLNSILNILNYQILTTNANSLSVKLQKSNTLVGDGYGGFTTKDLASPGLDGNLPLLSFLTYPSVTTPWTPIELNSPLNLTLSQITGLMAGISARRRVVETVRASKVAAVDALTTVAQVIAYDVIIGWPYKYITPMRGDLILSTTAPTIS